jgi:hypothetical protein
VERAQRIKNLICQSNKNKANQTIPKKKKKKKKKTKNKKKKRNKKNNN